MINFSKNIIGHHNIIDKLLHKFQNNTLHNSLIFFGQNGIGKTTLAFNFISKILKIIDNNNYNNHISLLYKNSHPNIRYITRLYDEKKDKTSEYISIDQIRGLNNFISQSSFNNVPKFIIFDSADNFNKNSSNSLLKILEEPSNNTYFILISHQLSNILPTIRSRCIKFYFNKPSKDIFYDIIKNQNVDINNANIDFLYLLSNGSPGTAIKISTDKMNDLYNSIVDITNYNKNDLSKKIYDLSEYVSSFSNDEYKVFLMLLRFILINIIKNNLGILSEFTTLNNQSFITKLISFEILEFIDNNEKDLFIYNLDKKIFCLNIFIPLKKSYE